MVNPSGPDMDPLSVLGISAAVVQFVEVGTRVAKRLAEYIASSPGDVPRSLQAIQNQLPLLINSLSRIKSDLHSSDLDLETKCIIRGVVTGCTAQIDKVEDILGKVVAGTGESMGVKLKKVLASFKHEDKILSIEKNLQTYIQVLILHHVVDPKDVPSATGDEREFFDVRERRLDVFLERKDLTEELDGILGEAARSRVTRPTIAVLLGDGGVGKSQLALEYAHQTRDLGLFRTAFWLDASTESNVKLGLESIAAVVRRSTEGTQSDKIEFAKKFLANWWHPWLLVLDDYHPSQVDKLHALLPDRGYGGIIITTRHSSAQGLGHCVPVPRFLSADEREYLKNSLFRAIEREDADEASIFINQGADPNSVALNAWPVLHRAVLLGLTDIVALLLSKGATQNHSAASRPPIYWASDKGSAPILRLLLDDEDRHGYNPQTAGHTDAFSTAAEHGHVEILKLLLERRQVDLLRKNNYNQTALQRAAKNGHDNIVSLLLDHGAEFKDITESERAFLAAASAGHLQTMKVIWKYGSISPNCQAESGETALYYAAGQRDDSTYKATGQAMAKWLLGKGADPNLMPQRDGGPLHRAALYGHDDIVRLLLENGAEPTKEDDSGYTPLLNTVKYKCETTFHLLLAINIPDDKAKANYMEQALLYAARNGNRDYVLALIRAGTRLECVDWTGGTPLLLAINHGHVQTARMIAKYGSRQDIADKQGRLPLLLAAEKGHELLVRDLLKSCKTPDVQDKNEDTPLCLAAANGHEKVVKVLLNSGADPDLANKYMETPLDLAEEKGYDKVVKVLQGLEIS